jgi:glycine/D-amino acid oxidase-like deaminating enzyme
MKHENYKEKSYWLSTRDYVEDKPLSSDIRVDVAIVGGGFTGLTTAHFLKKAEPSLNVALLESQVIGFGASGRNGGFNMTLFGLTMGITAMRFGRANARQAHLYMERAVDTLKALVEENSIDCDYEHPGFLRVATSPHYARRIRHEIDLAHSLGLTGIEWIGQDAVREQVNSPTYLGAWSEPRCGLINPAKLAWGWKGVIKGQGVAVYERSPVINMVKSSGRIVLKTPNGRVNAAKVVLATNAYSHLVPGIKWKQAPIWTHIVLTEPLSEKQLEPIGWKNRQGIEDARNLVHYYRLTADNRLLMGGRDISFSFGYDMDRDLNERVFEGLKKDVAATFPSLAGVRYTHQWGGPVSVTLDLAPAMGYLGDRNVIYSVGCMGHGVSLTHLNGATAADLALERKTDLTDTFFVNRRVLPWPPEPVRMAASKAILAAMRIQDSFTD